MSSDRPSSDPSFPLAWIGPELAELQREGLLRRRRTFEPGVHAQVRIAGRTYENFAGNDYLGLASDPRVQEAAAKAAREFGAGARASPLVSGRTPVHELLEKRLAEFEGAEAAIVFPSGYAANVGVLTALAGPEDVVLCDRLNHASLVDGCRQSGAKFRVYSHGELDRLESELQKAESARRRLIVTDTVFSMDGDLAPMRELLALATTYDALLVVDEAHATGVYGSRGTGVVEEMGLDEFACRTSAPGERIVRIGTLSKAIGAQGGFVAGSQELIDWLWNRARTQIYSTALAPPAAAAAAEAVAILRGDSGRRLRLQQNVAALRAMLHGLPVRVLGEERCPIVPVLFDQPERTIAVAASLEQAGFLVGAIRPPTVPRGTSRLRITVCALHAPEAVAGLVGELGRVLNEES